MLYTLDHVHSLKMVFSSLRKAAPRPEHKERRQPKNRFRLGLLEKHKDYVLRAQNYHTKEKQIKMLREKARLRNPDEFYFAMQNSKTDHDIHQVSRNDFTPDMIRLMKTQDYKYVSYQRNLMECKLSKMKQEHSEINIDFSQNINSHIIFSEDNQHINVSKTLDIIRELNPKIKQRMEKMTEQVKSLKKVEHELWLKYRLTYSKGKRKKVGKTDDGAEIYKWREERQK